jgi:plastocyanin
VPGKRLITRDRTILAFAGGLVAVVLLMSACGGSSGGAMAMPAGGGSSGAMEMPAGGAPPPASYVPAHTDQVQITNFAFAPAVITVVAGTTVKWTNEDTTQHDVFAPPVGLQSPVLNQNDSYAHTFSSPGTYRYICSIHPFMHGTVVVTSG